MENIIKKALENDNEAVEELIKNLEPLIYSSIKKYGFNRNVNDLYQEGCLAILEALKDFDESKGAHFLAYVKLQLKYSFYNMQILKEDLILDKEYFEDGGVESLIDYIIDEDVNIELDYEDKELREKFLKAIDDLYPREKEVILLYYYKGLSLGEISEVLGISYNTVVNNRNRGIERLRDLLVNI